MRVVVEPTQAHARGGRGAVGERRERPRARMAGTMVCEGGEPAFWPHSDYS